MAIKKASAKVIKAPTPPALKLGANKQLAIGLAALLVAIVVALFALTAALFSKVDNRYPSTISFSATGSADVVPDAIKVSASVSILANTASNALSQSAQVADDLRMALSQNNIDPRNISSANLSLYPEYSYPPNGSKILLGYRASQNFEINILDSKKAGLIIDQIIAKTGDDLQINSIAAYISDPAAATQAARADAMSKAKAKAKAYAKLADVDLGDIISINEDNSQMQPMPMQMAKEANAGTSFDMGLSKVSVSIYISYEVD